jgi:hypothetical protein
MRRVGRHRYKDVIDFDEDDESFVDATLAADRGIYFSSDGLRRNTELLNVTHKKRRLNPTELQDELADWIPVPDKDFTEDGARNPPRPDTSGGTSTILGKRKEYISTVSGICQYRIQFMLIMLSK